MTSHSPPPERSFTPTQVAVAVTLIVTAASLSPLGRSLHTPFWQRVSDAVHFPLFLGLSWAAVEGISSGGVRRPIATLIAGMATFALGAAIERIQPYFGRSESLTDLANGTLGIAAGLILATILARGSRTRAIPAFIAVALAAQLLLLLPAATELRATLWQERSFPVLADFEDAIEERLWSVTSENGASPPRAARHASHGTMALELPDGAGSACGVELRLSGQDWSRFSALEIDVFSEKARTLNMRIDDEGDCTELDDRFNRAFELHPGWSNLRVTMQEIASAPAKRRLDLRAVERLILFREKEQGGAIYVDYIRLVR